MILSEIRALSAAERNAILNRLGGTVDVPYNSDLNAVHEVEKTFVNRDDGTWGKYVFHLGEVSRSEGTPRCHATADQRTTALILTLSEKPQVERVDLDDGSGFEGTVSDCW